MSLTLHYHPLSSFCHKVLIPLYENAVPFTPHLVDLGDAASRGVFEAIWPIAKFPVLQDTATGRTVPESSLVIEYLDRHYPGPLRMIPEDFEAAFAVRHWDRFYDLNVSVPMQKIVGDRIRPAGAADPFGVDDARRRLGVALGMVDREMTAKPWAAGEDFSMADCAAAPALFYADKVAPLAEAFPNAKRYLDRLMARPAFARVLSEAEPYFKMFPA